LKILSILLSLAALAACGTENVESSSEGSAAIGRLNFNPNPQTALGSLDERPGYTFSVVSGGAFIGPDRFVILDAQGSELKIYSRSGEHLRTFGRRGEGPGELGRLPELVATSDGTIRVWDGLQQRLTVFDEHGQLLSTDRPMAGLEIRFVQLAGVLSDGRVVWKQPNESRGGDDAPRGEYRDTTFHVLRSADGASDTLAWTLATEAYRTDADGVQITTPVIFGRAGFALLGGDRLIYGISDEPLLRSKNSDGSDGPSFQWNAARDPISGREIDSLRVESSAPWRMRQRTGGPQLVAMAGTQLSVIATAPARQTRPHFSDVLVNGTGDVLVQRATDLFSGEHEWILFSEQGTLIGHFSSPRGLRVLDFTRREILGYTLDEFDLPTIQIHALGAG
jgi:hypothetical protein